LLGKPSLYQTKARNDWDKRTLTLGQHKRKVVLQMYPMQYHGGTQEEESKFTSNVESVQEESNEDIPTITQLYQPHSTPWPKQTRSGQMYMYCQLGEYKLFCDNNEDFDEVIRKWMNFRNVLQLDNASKWEPSKSTSKIEWYGPKGDMMVFFQ
jgi:hypothetical protein